MQNPRVNLQHYRYLLEQRKPVVPVKRPLYEDVASQRIPTVSVKQPLYHDDYDDDDNEGQSSRMSKIVQMAFMLLATLLSASVCWNIYSSQTAQSMECEDVIKTYNTTALCGSDDRIRAYALLNIRCMTHANVRNRDELIPMLSCAFDDNQCTFKAISDLIEYNIKKPNGDVTQLLSEFNSIVTSLRQNCLILPHTQSLSNDVKGFTETVNTTLTYVINQLGSEMYVVGIMVVMVIAEIGITWFFAESPNAQHSKWCELLVWTAPMLLVYWYHTRHPLDIIRASIWVLVLFLISVFIKLRHLNRLHQTTLFNTMTATQQQQTDTIIAAQRQQTNALVAAFAPMPSSPLPTRTRTRSRAKVGQA